MFGMHIGSVLSGLGIRNVSMDIKMLSLPVFWVKNGSKTRVFSMFGVSEGTFFRTFMRRSCLGCMVEGFL